MPKLGTIKSPLQSMLRDMDTEKKRVGIFDDTPSIETEVVENESNTLDGYVLQRLPLRGTRVQSYLNGPSIPELYWPDITVTLTYEDTLFVATIAQDAEYNKELPPDFIIIAAEETPKAAIDTVLQILLDTMLYFHTAQASTLLAPGVQLYFALSAHLLVGN